MTITKTQREQAETTATPAQLFLYSTPEAGGQLWDIATKFNLTDRNTYRVFTMMIGDIILGFYKQEDLNMLISETLPQVQGTQKITLEADLKVFLYPLTLPSHTVTNIPDMEIAEVELQSEITETEKEFEAIQGIRTMASDMHNVKNPPEVVHTSSQAELLNRHVPTASPEPSSRWETDR